MKEILPEDDLCFADVFYVCKWWDMGSLESSVGQSFLVMTMVQWESHHHSFTYVGLLCTATTCQFKSMNLKVSWKALKWAEAKLSVY